MKDVEFIQIEINRQDILGRYIEAIHVWLDEPSGSVPSPLIHIEEELLRVSKMLEAFKQKITPSGYAGERLRAGIEYFLDSPSILYSTPRISFSTRF
jgi:hypothetical protein